MSTSSVLRTNKHGRRAEQHIVDLVIVEALEDLAEVDQLLAHRTRLAPRAQAASRESCSKRSSRCSTVMRLTRRIIARRESAIGAPEPRPARDAHGVCLAAGQSRQPS